MLVFVNQRTFGRDLDRPTLDLDRVLVTLRRADGGVDSTHPGVAADIEAMFDRGWTDGGIIKTQSQIRVPRRGKVLAAGRHEIGADQELNYPAICRAIRRARRWST